MKFAHGCLAVCSLVACATAVPGCLPQAYVYPKFERISVKDVNADPGDIFAVLATHRRRGNRSLLTAFDGKTDGARLTALPIPNRDISKTILSTEAFAGFTTVMTYTAGWIKSDQTVLRLYRPGYLLEELPAGTRFGTIQWKKASGSAEEELAVDELISVPRRREDFRMLGKDERRWFLFEFGISREMPPNEIAAFKRRFHAERSILEFAAAEYERIARKYEDRVPEDSRRFDTVSPVVYERLAEPGLYNRELSLSRLREKARLVRWMADP